VPGPAEFLNSEWNLHLDHCGEVDMDGHLKLHGASLEDLREGMPTLKAREDFDEKKDVDMILCNA
jgi:hypothetical protein